MTADPEEMPDGPSADEVGRADEHLDWDDDALFPRENARRHLYRRLQSWYRQEHLHALYGWTKPRAATAKRRAIPARRAGNLLDPGWVAKNPAANFLPASGLSELIVDYVDEREAEVLRMGGSLEPVRLRTNLLSSMPLCFNLFAPLRAHPDEAIDLLRRGFQLDAVELTQVAGIDGIECEWAPPPGAGIGDRTAFDAVVAYRNGDDETCLLGIETKYTEPFSRTQYGPPNDKDQETHRTSYVGWTQAGWFHPGAEDRLYRPATNQLWRNVMLAAACERIAGIDHVDVAVVALHGDPHAVAALNGVRADLEDKDKARLRDLSLERVVRLTDGRALHRWSAAFRERYLDTTPVTTAGVKDRDRLQRRLDQLFPAGCCVTYDIGEEEPYEFHCPHPVACLVDRHLELYLWHEGNWAGSYLVVHATEASGVAGPALTIDGGRFVLGPVDDPDLQRAMRQLRLTGDAFVEARDGSGS